MRPGTACTRRFGLPTAGPAVYTQVSGALLVALAYVLWTRRIAAAVAVFNVLSSLLIVGWRLVTDLDVGLRGTAILAVAAAMLAALALLAGRIAARPVLAR